MRRSLQSIQSDAADERTVMKMPKKKQPKMIRAFVKHPNQDPYLTPLSAELEAMQKLVGGYLQEVAISTDIVILCDEEGELKGKPYNCTFVSHDLVGTLVFVGVNKDIWADCPLSYQEFRQVFRGLFKGSEQDG